jgi:predicted aspartyl protease
LLVDIGFDPAYNPQGPTVPAPGISGVHALVDTGATESCIDSLLAAQIGLPPVNMRPIAGVSGVQTTTIYLAQVRIPSLGFTIYGEFAGVDLQAGGQLHVALIGRTFLQNFTMVYDGLTGDVHLTAP